MVNKERGEVAFECRGKTFVLCAELGRVAAWTAEIGERDIEAINERMQVGDPVAILSALNNFCISDNADEIAETVHFTDFGKAMIAIATALAPGEEPGGNASTAKANNKA